MAKCRVARTAVIDVGNWELVTKIPTGDGHFVYVSDWLGNTVRVYDAKTLEKVAELGDLNTPTGISTTSRRDETLGH